MRNFVKPIDNSSVKTITNRLSTDKLYHSCWEWQGASKMGGYNGILSKTS